MKTGDFDYALPPELIAAYPAPRRDASRLMVVERTGDRLEHKIFSDLPELLRPGDCLVVNESRVIPARLVGRREGGGRAEALLCHREGEDLWRALVRPARKLGPGKRILLASECGGETGFIRIEQALPSGERLVRLESRLKEAEFIDLFGRVPLPPYILAARRGRRGPRSEGGATSEEAEDRERYQTVYSTLGGSVAAPTAGLHFTPELLRRIEAKGVEIRRVRLDVGPGTFAPVKSDDPRRHVMHRERFVLRAEEARAIEAARSDGERRIVAVGTTVARVLESLMQSEGRIVEADAWTDLLILPGHEFRAVRALITNFHLPRSTLLMLVCAFAGRERILRAYAEAIRIRYRFYSYGDAMLIQ